MRISRRNFPPGNGHLGAMVSGSIDLERIAFSELLVAGRYEEARSFCQQSARYDEDESNHGILM